jgi:formate C-acetyltransferase
VFLVACYLLRQTSYIQVGGLDAQGRDNTNRLSYLILEAAHRINIPTNVGVAVGKGIDPRLARRGIEILFEDQGGSPKFIGIENAIRGFCRNGYPVELARRRVYCGCHWFAIPGREYTLNDTVKINLAVVLDVALHEMLNDERPSVAELWSRFERHLMQAIEAIGRGIDFQVAHMHEVMPELPKDLCCRGPLEKGLDASHHGVEHYNMCVDGAALATVADSFAALEARIEFERKLTWGELATLLNSNWAGPRGERARLMMRSIPRYGSGDSRADWWAVRVSQIFARCVSAKPTPGGLRMVPGLFSWANAIRMGKNLGATPNGRRAGEPISHGANPDPGFRVDGAPSALATAVALVQPGYGNAAPMQIDLDPGIAKDEGGLEAVSALIQGHVKLGGTEVNINVVDADKLRAAHRDPSQYPDLVVRVTGFSAYFSSLSPEFRQMVIDRLIAKG